METPFHPHRTQSFTVLFSLSYLCSLCFSDIQAITWDYERFIPDFERPVLLREIKHAYHRIGSKDAGGTDSSRALHELLLRLIYELLSGHISMDDIRYHTWTRSRHRERMHGLRIHRLLSRVRKNEKALRVLHSVRWL